MSNPTSPVTVAFVLASYTPDAPAGMERATAALAHGLRQLGHRALILTTASQPDDTINVVRLHALRVRFPCEDTELREAVQGQSHEIAAELDTVYREHDVDVAVYVDALWGLGRIAPTNGLRSVLAAHVIGHDEDLTPALERTHRVIAPSPTVLDQAHDRGYDTSCWQIVPNALLDEDISPRPQEQRDALRSNGPIRVLARLGPEKNVPALLDAGRLVERSIDVIVGMAGFEVTPDAQTAEWDRCCHSAAHLQMGTIRGDGLTWAEVPPWLGDAAIVVVPSARETFGLVALEAMSVGTPVVAYAVDNLPALIGTGDDAGGVLVPRSSGEYGLWRAAEDLLADPLRYAHISRAAYYRSRDYRPTTVAETFLKAVR